MADTPATKRVAVLDPDGNFGTVDASDLQAVERAGGRVLSKQEVAQREVQARYDAKPLAEKVVGIAKTAALATPLAPVVAPSIGDEAPPEIAAFASGTRAGLTGGLSDGVTRQVIDRVGTHAQGDAFAAKAEQERDASPIARGAGQLYGMGIGTALGAATPAGAINAAGNVAEHAVARGLAGMATQGAMGRALATGASLAVRGGVEGALLGASEAYGEAMLGDHELAADKLWAATGMGALGGAAGGAVLGTTGSLALSGVRGTVGLAGRGLSRVLGRGEAKAGAVADDIAGAVAKSGDDATAAAQRLGRETVDEGVRSGKSLAEVTGTNLEQEGAALRAWVDHKKLQSTQKDGAYELAWKSIGAGQGLQSTTFAKRAERYLPNGVRDVGEVMMRKGIINAEEGWMAAARNGRPADMLPKIETALEQVGQRIGDITAHSPATVSSHDIVDAVLRVSSKYDQAAATKPVARALRTYAEDLFTSLDEGLIRSATAEGRALQGVQGKVPVQDVLRERKALDKLVFGDAPLDAKMGTEVKRELRAELEGLVTKALDDASGTVPGKLKAEYQALKKDYTALSIASEAAEDSAARMAKARSVSLTDYMAGGGSIPVTMLHKVVRERGNAAAAVLLHRMAEMGTLTKAIQSVDDAVTRASRGVLQAPKVGPMPGLAAGGKGKAPAPVRERAEEAAKRVAAIQADPGKFVEDITRATEGMQQTAPNLAGSLSRRMTDAAAFLATKLPNPADPDPFDPHPSAKMTQAQAMEFMRYVDYVDRPTKFFEEAERGQITFEGVEVAKALMPRAFAEMQTRVAEGLAEMLAKGQKVPLRQRERLGILMDFPAVPSQRPDHGAFLQGNVVGSEKMNQPKPPGGASKPTAIKSPSSALDRLEERGAGRR